jgi:hypothetical protein
METYAAPLFNRKSRSREGASLSHPPLEGEVEKATALQKYCGACGGTPVPRRHAPQ